LKTNQKVITSAVGCVAAIARVRTGGSITKTFVEVAGDTFGVIELGATIV
jgi:hypothetical protein